MTENANRVTTFTYREPPSVEPDWYDATLYAVEQIVHKDYGERWRWVFTIPGAGEDGKDVTVSKWTTPYLSKKSRANDIVEALRGRRVGRGESIDFAELADKPCSLEVGRDDEGFNTVKTVARPRTTGASAKPADEPAPAAKPSLAEKAAAKAAAVVEDPEYLAFLEAKRARAAQSAPDELPPAPTAAPADEPAA